MAWAAILWDGPEAAQLRRVHLAAHLAYIEAHLAKCFVGGPLRHGPGQGGGYAGSLIVYAVDTEDEARALLEADPYYTGGVWTDTTLLPFNPVAGLWVGGTTW